MLQNANFHHGKEATNVAFIDREPHCLLGLFKKLPIERLAAGQSLFFEGDPAKGVFEVVEGSLRIFKIISDGRRVITGFLHAGDIIGVSLKDRYLYSAEAITDIRIRRISRKSFDAEVANSPELRPEVFARLCDEMAAAQDQVVLLSRKNAEERVCTFLLKELLRVLCDGRGDLVIELPMTRLDIADYLGLTIETVSRTMTKLNKKAIVVPAGRHSIRILKRSGLAQLAGNDDENGGSRMEMAPHLKSLRH
ncbi:CRP/FNR family transcriptional regulator [Rhizobium binae]|uniref:CRP/FNR family transcriptional regulator n=1 Tax=Rhizobium binae TaxID=1138190 RepID=A0ABV2MK17_9HYPH|nr:helix-turn-helix domain-containing protein [Rhizobium binae]NKL48533.1 helix-turn-helix domain-containing protein [Rhizobium leguminosarum bv. viciae]MBX4927904.1 helix-turn-helix domain-containing protein [Rhizobium binae]MBX4952126.1 helix-turn-helix domain-containing protein [Rhizobium binae]MBX4961486.1 helix-turn-helix domain-containing protein [Rhizobium binae]MBX4991427.1 helix-turn-helix domain-containing protein [Rhizobium binae]